MKYEMPALTDEHREELIDRLEDIICLNEEHHNLNELDLISIKITLAALTAVPKYVSVHGEKMDLMYEAPPVPVLKRIELNSDDVDTPIDWYAGAKTRDMVIDTLRAEGCEVKE